MIRTHKIRIFPNRKQERVLFRSCEVARFVYNLGLARWEKEYREGKKPNHMKISKDFNAIKKESYSWVTEVTKCASEGALRDLGMAFNRFFRGIGGYPRFKRRKGGSSFHVSNDRLYTRGKFVKIQKVAPMVRMAEELRIEGRILTGMVSVEAQRWFVSITVETPDNLPPPNVDTSVGIDLGINKAIVCSDGKFYESPKPLKKNLKKLRAASKSLSRKVKGSQNWKKQVARLGTIHWRIGNIRQDFVHKATSEISKEYSLVFLEDLNARGMMANHKLSRAISDIGFGRIGRQLAYKTNVRKIDRFYPSSKTCSRCGHVKDHLRLSERTFVCESCGLVIDRDANASHNIYTVGLTEFKACGLGGSGSPTLGSGDETTEDEAGSGVRGDTPPHKADDYDLVYFGGTGV